MKDYLVLSKRNFSQAVNFQFFQVKKADKHLTLDKFLHLNLVAL